MLLRSQTCTKTTLLVGVAGTRLLVCGVIDSGISMKYTFAIEFDEWGTKDRNIQVGAIYDHHMCCLPNLTRKELIDLRNEIDKFLNEHE